MNLKEIIKHVEDITIIYTSEEALDQLKHTLTLCEENNIDNNLESILDKYINVDRLEEITKEVLDSGIQRLYYFLQDVDLRKEIFRLDAYGNLENVNLQDLKDLKEEILDELYSCLEKEGGNDE